MLAGRYLSVSTEWVKGEEHGFCEKSAPTTDELLLLVALWL